MKNTQYIFLFFLTLVLSACQTQTQTQSLSGSTWSLILLNGHSLVPGSHIEIQFDRDTLSGFSGCNSYGGSYQAGGNHLLAVDEIASTAMACLTPEGINEQEGEYLQALQKASTFLVSGNHLEISDSNGNLLLVFQHQTAEPALQMDSLIGSGWQVFNVNGESLIPGSQITMQFIQPGMVRGFGGCRTYQAEFNETEQGVGFTSISMGEEDCKQEDLLIQEQDFTDFFTWADHFELVGENLILFTQRGEEIVFIPFEE